MEHTHTHIHTNRLTKTEFYLYHVNFQSHQTFLGLLMIVQDLIDNLHPEYDKIQKLIKTLWDVVIFSVFCAFILQKCKQNSLSFSYIICILEDHCGAPWVGDFNTENGSDRPG